MVHLSFRSLILLLALFSLAAGTRPIRSENDMAAPVSSSSATISQTLSPIARAAVSTYWVATELLHQHVVPAIRDQLWQPTCQFLREKEEAAIQRRLQSRQQQPVTSPTVESNPDQQRKELPPPQPFAVHAPIHPPTFVVRKTKQVATVTQARNLSGKNSWSLLLLPIRFVKLSLTAWILAELLDRVGMLHEETPAILRSQVHRVWYDLQPHWFHLRDWIVTTWHRIAPHGLPTKIPTKYQFAIGATIGMISSPFLSLACKPAIVLYALAEINARAKVQGRWNLEYIFHPTLAHQIDEGLENLRQTVSHLLTPMTSPQLLLGPTGGGAAGNSSGVASEATTYSLGLAPSSPIAESPRDPEGQDDLEKHRCLEMIRHGLVAGVSLGFIGKL